MVVWKLQVVEPLREPVGMVTLFLENKKLIGLVQFPSALEGGPPSLLVL